MDKLISYFQDNPFLFKIVIGALIASVCVIAFIIVARKQIRSKREQAEAYGEAVAALRADKGKAAEQEAVPSLIETQMQRTTFDGQKQFSATEPEEQEPENEKVEEEFLLEEPVLNYENVENYGGQKDVTAEQPSDEPDEEVLPEETTEEVPEVQPTVSTEEEPHVNVFEPVASETVDKPEEKAEETAIEEEQAVTEETPTATAPSDDAQPETANQKVPETKSVEPEETVTKPVKPEKPAEPPVKKQPKVQLKPFVNKPVIKQTKPQMQPQTTAKQPNKATASGEKKETMPEHKTRYTGKWLIYKDGERYAANLIASNGEIILRTEAYTALSGVKSGIETIKNNIAKDNFAMSVDKNGNYFFKLYSSSTRLLCVSEGYSTRSVCESAIASVKRFSQSAVVEIKKDDDE